MTELFTIKPLEWEDAGKDRYEACPLFNVRFVLRRRESNRGWEWRTINGTYFTHCASPEEGKQLAEQHWRDYIAQALVPVETEQ